MSPSLENLTCPVCSATLNFEQIASRLEADRTFDRLIAVSVPLGNIVLQYLTLFTPAKQRLTNSKKLRLIGQLLPDLERRAITHKGRDWPAPLPLWAAAMEQMLSARANDRLTLPMTGHTYLYSILAAQADKQEGAAEQQREQERRTGPRPATANANANAPVQLAQALQPAPRPSAAPAPAGTSPAVRKIREEIERKKKAQQP